MSLALHSGVDFFLEMPVEELIELAKEVTERGKKPVGTRH